MFASEFLIINEFFIEIEVGDDNSVGLASFSCLAVRLLFAEEAV